MVHLDLQEELVQRADEVLLAMKVYRDHQDVMDRLELLELLEKRVTKEKKEGLVLVLQVLLE